MSPGFSPIAFGPVTKLTVSVSVCSLNNFHLPNLCACPRDVVPNASNSFLISRGALPVALDIRACVSSTYSAACL